MMMEWKMIEKNIKGRQTLGIQRYGKGVLGYASSEKGMACGNIAKIDV
jgi:hypothetical protein